MFKQVRFVLSVLLHTLLVVASITISITIKSAQAADPVGLTAGQLSVDESGATTCHILINASAGRSGMTPQVSNNLVTAPFGVDLSLTGLSCISCCRQTHIQGVRLTAQDKFCLDGQRTILKSITYGVAGSTYYWDASDVDTASDHDAFVQPEGTDSDGVTRILAISVIEDIKHNYMVFIYDKNTQGGAFYIDKIQYVGNEDQRDRLYAETYFIYEDYKKGAQEYLSVAYPRQTQLLTHIDTKIDGNTGHEAQGDIYPYYFLEYEFTRSIEYLRLIFQIQECTDTYQRICLLAAAFDWQLPSLLNGGFNSSSSLASGTDSESTAQIFHINDDIQDVVYTDNGAWLAKFRRAINEKQ